MDLLTTLESCKDLQPMNKRRLKVLGIITKALEPYRLRPVLVGGCAVEYYTLGGYATFDMDIVVENHARLDDVLQSLRFKKEGRHWFREDLDIAIECPSSNLSGETAAVTKVEIDGFIVYVLGLEDLIIDRLNAAVHWKSREDRRWTTELLLIGRGNLNLNYLAEKAKVNQTETELKNILKENGF